MSHVNCMWEGQRPIQNQGFLRKEEKELGNFLIFMEFMVWDEGVQKQSKPKL